MKEKSGVRDRIKISHVMLYEEGNINIVSFTPYLSIKEEQNDFEFEN